MSLSAEVKHSGYSQVNGPYSTPTISVTAGRLYIAYLLSYRNDSIQTVAANPPTGCGLSFSQYQTHQWDTGGAGRGGSTAWVAGCAASTSGPITFTTPDVLYGAMWAVVEITGIDGGSPLVQSNYYNSPGANDASGSLSLAAFANAQNMNLSFACNGAAAGGGVPPTISAPFTTIISLGDTARQVSFSCGVALNTPTCNITSNPARLGMISVEIRNLGLVSKTLTGSINPTGTLGKLVSLAPFAGGITPSGALSFVKTKALALAGAIVPTGALSVQAYLVTLRSFAGSITPTGTLSLTPMLTYYKNLAGSIAPSGILAVRFLGTHFVALSGAINPFGILGRVKRHRLLTPIEPQQETLTPTTPAEGTPAPSSSVPGTLIPTDEVEG